MLRKLGFIIMALVVYCSAGMLTGAILGGAAGYAVGKSKNNNNTIAQAKTEEITVSSDSSITSIILVLETRVYFGASYDLSCGKVRVQWSEPSGGCSAAKEHSDYYSVDDYIKSRFREFSLISYQLTQTDITIGSRVETRVTITAKLKRK